MHLNLIISSHRVHGLRILLWPASDPFFIIDQYRHVYVKISLSINLVAR